MSAAPSFTSSASASRTPAAFLGLESEMGRIAPGYRADLVAFNQNFEVVGTWVGGRGSMRETSGTFTEAG